MSYLQEFRNNDDVIEQYSAPKDALDGATVYLAWYRYGNYCGSSWVIFEKDGKLYEVNGSHCSCNGLEGCWEPEETTWDALSIRNPFRYDECEGAGEAEKIYKSLIEQHKENL